MTPTEIKIRLLLAHRTQTEIARGLGCDHSAVSNTIRGRRRTPRIRRAIAEAVGASYLEMWGEADPGMDRLPAGRRGKCVTGVTDSGGGL